MLDIEWIPSSSDPDMSRKPEKPAADGGGRRGFVVDCPWPVVSGIYGALYSDISIIPTCIR